MRKIKDKKSEYKTLMIKSIKEVEDWRESRKEFDSVSRISLNDD